MQYRDYTDLIVPKASNIFLSLVIIAVIWSDLFFSFGEIMPVDGLLIGDSPLAFDLLGDVDLYSKPSLLITFGMLLCVSFLMVWMNDLFSFIKVRSILPAFFFGIIPSLLMRPHALSISMLIVLLMMLALFASFRLCESPGDSTSLRVFNIGLIFGLLSLFSLSLLTYIIVFLPFFYRIKVLSFKTILALLMGMVLPYIYVVLLYAYWGELQSWVDYFADWRLWNSFTFLPKMSTSAMGYFIVVTSITLYSVVRAILTSPTQTIKDRVESLFIVFNFLWTFFLLLIGVSDCLLLFPLFFFFSSFLMGQSFSLEFNLLIKILWGVFALSSVLYLVFPNYNWT